MSFQISFSAISYSRNHFKFSSKLLPASLRQSILFQRHRFVKMQLILALKKLFLLIKQRPANACILYNVMLQWLPHVLVQCAYYSIVLVTMTSTSRYLKCMNITKWGVVHGYIEACVADPYLAKKSVCWRYPDLDTRTNKLL